jgi:hypothetical protein
MQDSNCLGKPDLTAEKIPQRAAERIKNAEICLSNIDRQGLIMTNKK